MGVIAGSVEGRRAPSEVTLFKSVGLAVEDVVAAKLTFDRAVEAGVGIELWPCLVATTRVSRSGRGSAAEFTNRLALFIHRTAHAVDQTRAHDADEAVGDGEREIVGHGPKGHARPG
ncbi:MAG: hypothetical protein FJW27_16195 [Acidimicrobiia bacterium]|nr:hypothetical protein [Acidimicrobiia bacterium]